MIVDIIAILIGVLAIVVGISVAVEQSRRDAEAVRVQAKLRAQRDLIQHVNDRLDAVAVHLHRRIDQLRSPEKVPETPEKITVVEGASNHPEEF